MPDASLRWFPLVPKGRGSRALHPTFSLRGFVPAECAAHYDTEHDFLSVFICVHLWRLIYLSNCASKAMAEGLKSIFLTKAAASVAPCSRSMRLSSHSTDSGP